MIRLSLATLAVLAIIFIVPIVVYGAFQSTIGAEMPKGASPAVFLLSVFISKIGTAVAFCAIFYVARGTFGGQWLLYAAIWWVMFALGEVGQSIGPDYSWKEALAGVISETIYLPAAAYLTQRILLG